MNHENMIISFTFVNLIMHSIDYKCVYYCKRLEILQFPFGGDVSILLPMRSSAGTLLGAQNLAGSRPLKPVHCSIAPESLTGIFRLIVPDAAESARPKCAEFSAIRAYTVRGGFERRGVKAGPQATAIAARSGLYASERFHNWNWFEFERTR
jgi:hypothetical protein